MSAKPASPKMPPDPDPTPMASGTTSENINKAAREEQKRSVKKNSRLKTILAGDPNNDIARGLGEKKNILG